MVCPHCQGAETVFDDSSAQKELKDYHKKGAAESTRFLLDVLREAGVAGLTLLDIGGGVGAIQHELITAGVERAVNVDASAAYLQVAKREAEARGYAEQVEYIHGDFVQIAPEIEAAEIVTLDRVVCCYPDARALVDLSSTRAKHYYALVYPRDFKVASLVVRIINFFAFRLRGNPFRIFIHPTTMIDSIVRDNGFKQIFHRHAGFWQVFVYERMQPQSAR